MENIGTFLFGVLLGWLLWNFFHPEGQKANITAVTIGTFIGIVLNATIIKTFTTYNFNLGFYLVGLCGGFFAERGLNWYRTWRKEQQEQVEKAWQEEYRLIITHWAEIDEAIQKRLYRKMRQIPPGKNAVQLFAHELTEWPFSELGKYRIMQMYVRKHIDIGVELKQITREDEEGEPQTYFYLELARR